MRTRLGLAALCLLSALAPIGLPGAAPARADGAGVFEYTATGRLPEYPSDITRTAFVDGTITGNGHVTGFVSPTMVTANLTLRTAAFTYQPIDYNVASFPYCLAASQASSSVAEPYDGSIDFTAWAPTVSGQVYRTGDTVLGTVTRVDVSFRFTFQRATAGTVVVVNPGTVTVHYNIVTGGSGHFTASFIGAGPGAVTYTDAVTATNNCVFGPPGPVDFAVTGIVHVAGT